MRYKDVFQQFVPKLAALKVRARSIFMRFPPEGEFPPLSKALKDPYGLLATGGELSPELVLAAYRRGIFLLYYKRPLRWWAPDPRMVLYPGKLKIRNSEKALVRDDVYRVTFDEAFEDVVRACGEREETWVNEEVIPIYKQLYEQGHAHSVEVWDDDNKLIAGLFGLSMGKTFQTDSLFTRKNNASKVAFIYLNCHLEHWGYLFNDMQFQKPHWERQGCVSISHQEFEGILQKGLVETTSNSKWSVDLSLDVKAWKPKQH